MLPPQNRPKSQNRLEPVRLWRWSGSPPIFGQPGVVARMSESKMIQGIQQAVSIPVIGQGPDGHIVEAHDSYRPSDIDYIDESEVLSPADDVHHIDEKQKFAVPFVCGAQKVLGEALTAYPGRRIL